MYMYHQHGFEVGGPFMAHIHTIWLFYIFKIKKMDITVDLCEYLSGVNYIVTKKYIVTW